MDATERRLQRLEREARILRIALIGVLVLVGIGAAADRGTEITARRIAIVDEAGEEVVVLSGKQNEYKMICRGLSRLHDLTAQKVTVENDGGRRKVVLDGQDGRDTLTVFGPANHERVIVSTTDDSAKIDFRGNRTALSVGMNDEGGGRLYFYDKKGEFSGILAPPFKALSR